MQLESTSSKDIMKSVEKYNDTKEKIFSDIKSKAIASTIPKIAEFSGRSEEIAEKLKKGQPLTHAEMDYLKENAPEIHRKSSEISRERVELDDELNKSTTKNHANRIKDSKVNSISQSITSTDNLETTMLAEMRIAAVNNAFDVFTETDKFAQLPAGNESIQALSISTLLSKESTNILSGARSEERRVGKECRL